MHPKVYQKNRLPIGEVYGASPKRFQQFQSVVEARRLLREGRSVLDATYSAGLTSPGRLNDLMVTVDGVTPGK